MPQPWDERAVVCGLQSGDRTAWALLYERYSERVWRYAARLMGDGFSTGDVVQETFLAAARSARQFDSNRGTLEQWLLGIAHHQTSLYWRSRAKGRTTPLPLGVAAVDEAAIADPAELLLRKDDAALVRGVLLQLTPDQATLLTGKYLDGLSLAELLTIHGGTIEGLRSRLARARREFRRLYELMTVNA